MNGQLLAMALTALVTIAGSPARASDLAPVPGQPARVQGHGVQRFDLERLLDLPVVELHQHPVWPPEQGRPPGPDFEHPVWPPEWFKGDLRIVLAAGALRLNPPVRSAPRL